jgi:fumarate reductase flavoprotein subunit
MRAERLVKTVDEYNDALLNGRLGDLAPARRIDLHDALPIRQAPFMAVRICAGITYTMGGIAIDEHARVLRPDGGVIDRLYAAGATTGGIEGGGSSGGYVGGLSKAGILGLRAAEHAARRLAA